MVLWGIAILTFSYVMLYPKDEKVFTSNIYIQLVKYYTLIVIYIHLFALFEVIFEGRLLYNEFQFRIMFAILSILLINYLVFSSKFLVDINFKKFSTIVNILIIVIFTFFWFTVPTSSTFFVQFIIALSTILVKAISIGLIFIVSKEFFTTDTRNLYDVKAKEIVSLYIYLLPISLIPQYDLSIFTLYFSLIYLCISILALFLGLITKTSFVRYLSLTFVYLTLAKIFLLDIPNSTATEKFINYTLFGIVLLGLSYLYNKFSKILLNKF